MMLLSPDLTTRPAAQFDRRRSISPQPARFPDGLHLRVRDDKDADGLHRLLTQESFQRHGSTLDPFTSFADTEAFLACGGPDKLEIVPTIRDEIVGFAGLYMLPGRQAHVGSFTMCVHEAFHGIGVGSVLMKAVIDVGFGLLGLYRIQATVFTDNTRALSLYCRFGFSIEGTLRRFAWREDGFVDAYLIALMRLPGAS